MRRCRVLPTAFWLRGKEARGKTELIASELDKPDNYYANVHTNVCPPGVIRGQLGDHGPSNN
jgi:hypothetical protein